MPGVIDDSDFDRAALAQASMSQIGDLRTKHKSQAAQDLLAPYEHRAFTRAVAQDDLPGAAATAVAIPAYTAAKALGLVKTRSSASMEEMKQAYIGLAEGLMKRKADPKEEARRKSLEKHRIRAMFTGTRG